MMRMILAVMLPALVLFAAAAGNLCGVCGGPLGERFLSDGRGGTFCSEACVETLLPRCSVCDAVCKGQYLVCDEAVYCSKACLGTVVPQCAICGELVSTGKVNLSIYGKRHYCATCGDLPPCSACGSPCRGGELPDGRIICAECAPTAIEDQHAAQQLFDAVRADLAGEFGIPNDHVILLRLVDRKEMESSTGKREEEDKQMRGYFRYSYASGKKPVRGVDDKCEIFILNHLPRDFMRDTMAHELVHDFLRHEVGDIDDDLLEEGFCEALAADYNIRLGLDNHNLMRTLSDSPVYGEGYRKMRSYVEQNGWPAALEEMRKHGRPIGE